MKQLKKYRTQLYASEILMKESSDSSPSSRIIQAEAGGTMGKGEVSGKATKYGRTGQKGAG